MCSIIQSTGRGRERTTAKCHRRVSCGQFWIDGRTKDTTRGQYDPQVRGSYPRGTQRKNDRDTAVPCVDLFDYVQQQSRGSDPIPRNHRRDNTDDQPTFESNPNRRMYGLRSRIQEADGSLTGNYTKNNSPNNDSPVL